jgi:Leucine rich repeat
MWRPPYFSSIPFRAKAALPMHMHMHMDMPCLHQKSNTKSAMARKVYIILITAFLIGFAGFLVSAFTTSGAAANTSAIPITNPTSRPLSAVDDSQPQRSLRHATPQLRRSITSLLLAHSITTPDRLEDPFSPASAALDWLLDVPSWTLDDDAITTRFALACLFFATHTTGSQWTNEDAWMTQTSSGTYGVHVCDWHGITCAESSEIVTQVNLTHNSLQGTIPMEFFKGLGPKLRVLDLSYNQLWGTLPEWSHLPELQTLLLQHNALTGPLPHNLQSMQTILQTTHLKHVQLHHNHFENMPVLPPPDPKPAKKMRRGIAAALEAERKMKDSEVDQ